MRDYFLADDLSGALDAAGAFHRIGRNVIVALGTDRWPEAGEDDVVGFTTETRNAAPSVAAAAVARAIALGKAHGARLLYKKIDSTLRGPVAAEVAALSEQLPGVRILFAPANPGVGRIVRDGVLFVHGVPVAETEFGRDPASPVRESDIRRLLGAAALTRVEVADAASDGDLAAAVARMEARGEPWVGVGSGALARPVAAQLIRGARNEFDAVASARACHGEAAADDASAERRLMICGSAHRTNRAQATALAREREVEIFELKIAEASEAAGAALAALRARGGTAVLVEAERRDRRAVVQSVASVGAEIIRAGGLRRVFVTGGETAFALSRALGITNLAFRAELESGLSVSGASSSAGPLLLAIKPGGFGDERTWIRAWDGLGAAALPTRRDRGNARAGSAGNG